MTIEQHPLSALEAIVLDTETTGLDPAKARLLQVGAVLIRHGRLLDRPVFDIKVNPGVAIPPETTCIHGIDAAAIAGAPSYGAIHADLVGFIGGRVLIGHNIGFDLAILTRENGLAGTKPFWNHILDTRVLGEICFPHLGGFTLDKLASHLKIAIDNRHDALGDAVLTARVFVALTGLLKARGIRTLAEAETACRRMTAVLEDYNRAGWTEPVRPRTSPDAVLARIDAFPFRHRVSDVAAMPPVHLGPGDSLGAAVRLMAEKRISSVFVSSANEGLVEPVGIVTERDVIRLIGERGAAVLEAPLENLASLPLLTIPADAFIYRAIGRMERRNIRHLGVVDEAGRMVGALSARDLLRLRGSDALALGDAIDSAETTADLAGAWARMPKVARRLTEEGIEAREVAAVISREIGALTRRAAADAEAEMIALGKGPSPAAYATLLLGSGGRGESLLIPDQDNATVFAETADASAADWFVTHGAIMNRMLDEIGIPLCKGNVMAGNPAWNGSRTAWHERIRSWTETTTPEDLLSVDIFFDFRFVHGDATLAGALRDEALAMARNARPMIKLLADQIGNWSPPIGMFGRLATENNRIDLKKGGLFPIVAAARCLALSHGIAARSTSDRLAALRAAQIGADQDLEAMEAALGAIMELILRQQIADIGEGLAPTTLVDVSKLSRGELAALKEQLASLRDTPTMVHDLLFATTGPV
jgi:CBS domain-containing protein